MPLFDLPSMGRALDRAASGDVTTNREDTLWDRISEEYAQVLDPRRGSLGL